MTGWIKLFHRTSEVPGASSSGGESGATSGAESVESNEASASAQLLETTIYSTLWFIGIELKPNNEALELNITDIILGFKDLSSFILDFFIFPVLTFFFFSSDV